MTEKKKLIILIISTLCLLIMAIIFVLVIGRGTFAPATREEYSNLQFSYSKQDKYVYDISFEVYNIELNQKEYNNLQLELINLDNSNSQVIVIENFMLDSHYQESIELKYSHNQKFNHIKLYAIDQNEYKTCFCSYTIDETTWFEETGIRFFSLLLVVLALCFFILNLKFNKKVFKVFYIILCILYTIFILGCSWFFPTDHLSNFIGFVAIILSNLIDKKIEQKKAILIR